MTALDILELTEADREHRRAFMEYCVQSAEERQRRRLIVLYEHFERWNRDCFGSQLHPPHFLVLEPRVPKAEGDYSPVGGWGNKSQIRLRPSLFDGTWQALVNGNHNPEGLRRYWLDVALHEVIHQYCYEILGKPERAEKGHGPTFARECSRVGTLMGLPPVGPARKSRNSQGLPSCAYWPTNVRPDDYYLGAYRPDLAPRRGSKARAGAPTAPEIDLGDELGDELEGLDAPTPATSSPLRPGEWGQLFAGAAGTAIAVLVERLARHHGVPVVWPATATMAGQATALVSAPLPVPSAPAGTSTTVVPPLPAPTALEPSTAEDAQILARLSPGFQPSRYQLGLFRFVLSGQGDGLVSAVAGSGKTTSLVEAARLIDTPGLFLAFNKHIADELSSRLRGTTMVARTIHSVGHGCVTRHLEGKKIRIDDRKYQKIAKTFGQSIVRSPGEQQQAAIRNLTELSRFARLTLTDPADRPELEQMIQHYGIELDQALLPLLLAALPELLREGEALARQQGLIDYTDQLYLPYRWQLQPAQLPFVLVDECQDLSAAQLDLALKCRALSGRMVFVGDENQSIQGFAGAANDSFWNIQKRTNATLLPLSVCYRCPTLHIDLARAIVPRIEARPGAPAGTVEHIKEEQLASHIRPGDMVICRLTAPLIKACIQLIERRIPARVRGRNLSEQLTAIVRAVAELPNSTYADFGRHLERYADLQWARLGQREGSEAQVEALNDRVEAVRVVWESSQAAGATALAEEIEALFSDEQTAVTLSTIHRAKGLEADRVFLLHPER
ncbi:MAG TPA: UvrD-helicase domain-containing protein, partial [Roseiflexaceae bacterium]|nr:UvrD-helicase domain-containing protein [Roseiflexaceae bacterium]